MFPLCFIASGIKSTFGGRHAKEIAIVRESVNAATKAIFNAANKRLK